MAMTDEQIERYSRHIILNEVGVKGQKKLLKGKVLIIGAGGLGAPAAMYLAAAGVGTIGIVDADEVDLSNLQRQIIHGTADVGKAKVKSAKETMNAMNPDVEVKTYRMFVDSSNIRELVREYDFIIDGTDNFPAKFLINDACVLEKKPFSHAGIIRFKGQLMTYVPGEGLATAVKLIYNNDFESKIAHLYELKDYFIDELEKLPDVQVNSKKGTDSAPQIVSASFKGVRAEVLLHSLEDKEIYVSSGSACSSNKPGLSNTLVAIGLDKELLDSTLRFSFCYETTKEELEYTIETLKQLLPMLRKYTRR